MYRNLTEKEILDLELHNCLSNDWSKVFVTNDTNLTNVSNVEFCGVVRLGTANLHNVKLSECEIGNNVTIRNVFDVIHNYQIGNNVTIQSVSTISTIGECSFANGVSINALNEFEGRSIRIFDKLNSQLAYLASMFRDRSDFLARIDSAINSYITSVTSTHGVIGDNCVIKNCNSLTNFKCDSDCELIGVQCLENSSIGKNSKLGFGVIIRDSIITNDSTISDGAFLQRCFVGEHCEIGEGFTANDSLMFANSVLMRGEAAALFAGPYTVSHHKSTLLIALQTSFFNAGSGSNQSNHRYRLGAIHQGVTERGVKLGSSSYLLLPGKVGSYSTVLGQHHKSVDFSSLPFSYLIDNGEPLIIPGINLINIGTIRDVDKWASRDGRTTSKYDYIDFSFEDNPFIASEIYSGYQTLTNLYNSDPSNEQYEYFGYKINRKSLLRGIELYRKALDRYIGLCCESDDEWRKIEWTDLSGAIISIDDLERILSSKFDSVEELTQILIQVREDYPTQKRLFARYLDYMLNGTCSDSESLKERSLSAIDFFEDKILSDSLKEFSSEVSISYINDFKQVREVQNILGVVDRFKNRNNTLRSIIRNRE